MYKIQVLVSGKGSTLDNLAFHSYDSYEGMVYGFIEISRVVADRECEARAVAEKWNLPFEVIKKFDHPDVTSWSEALLDQEVDLHVMGGFLSLIEVPEKWANKILNIHPSLLPAYGGKGMYGDKVHEAVIANKEQFTGCTVHIVDNEYDHGEIVEQVRQGVLPWDTAASLKDAVQEMENRLYPRTILNFLRGKRLHKVKVSD